jgi:hypothetical protein
VSRVYHNRGVVGGRRHLRCRCDSRSGQQMAHAAALVLQSLQAAGYSIPSWRATMMSCNAEDAPSFCLMDVCRLATVFALMPSRSPISFTS